MKKLKETEKKSIKSIMDQRGSAAVLIVMILLTFVVAVILGTWQVIFAQTKISVSSRQELQAWYEAESNLEAVISSLQDNCNEVPPQASMIAGSGSSAASFLYDINVRGDADAAVKNILARVRITYDPVQYLWQIKEDDINTAGAAEELILNGSLGISDNARIFIRTITAKGDGSLPADESLISGSEDFIDLSWLGGADGMDKFTEHILQPYYAEKMRTVDEIGQSSEPLIYIADSNINLHSIECCQPDILAVKGTVYVTDDFLAEDEQGEPVMPVIMADKVVINAQKSVKLRAYLLARDRIRVGAGTRAEIDGRILTDTLQIGDEAAGASLSIAADSSCRPQYLRPDVDIIYCREKNDLCK